MVWVEKEDLTRIVTMGKALNVWRKARRVNVAALKNKLITTHNVFGDQTARIVFDRTEPVLYPFLKTALMWADIDVSGYPHVTPDCDFARALGYDIDIPKPPKPPKPAKVHHARSQRRRQILSALSTGAKRRWELAKEMNCTSPCLISPLDILIKSNEVVRLGHGVYALPASVTKADLQRRTIRDRLTALFHKYPNRDITLKEFSVALTLDPRRIQTCLAKPAAKRCFQRIRYGVYRLATEPQTHTARPCMTMRDRVVALLNSHGDRVWSTHEIAQQLVIDHHLVSACLSILVRSGRISRPCRASYKSSLNN